MAKAKSNTKKAIPPTRYNDLNRQDISNDKPNTNSNQLDF